MKNGSVTHSFRNAASSSALEPSLSLWFWENPQSAGFWNGVLDHTYYCHGFRPKSPVPPRFMIPFVTTFGSERGQMVMMVSRHSGGKSKVGETE
jgi:hypothetical protein